MIFPVNGETVVDYIPGLSPIRLADLPQVVRNNKSNPVMPDESKLKYLIFTSIYELESPVFEALKRKSSFKIFNIGPASSYFKLKDIKTTTTTDDETSNYLQWLDLQPSSSVLYISLGSFMHIAMAQMDELASGLRGSGVRFLWVARREVSRLQEMSGDRGLVVEWCDQLRVLAHPSVGGFLSHCGWNSTMETALAGVPVLPFPIFHDQLPNAKMIVEDWGVGWRVLEREFDEKNLKKGDEIGELVKRFMDLENEERKVLSRNAKELHDICEREFANGESYQTNLDALVKTILSKC